MVAIAPDAFLMHMDTNTESGNADNEREVLVRFRQTSKDGAKPRTGLLRDILRDQADRLWATSLLEKGVLLGGLVLIFVGVVIVVGSLSGGSSSGGALISAESLTTDHSAVATTPTVRPVSTSTPQPLANVVASVPTIAVANRESCLAIQGTTYLSSTERTWYLGNCQVTTTLREDVAPTPTSFSPRIAPEPVSRDTFDADDATDIGASWIATQAETGQSVDRASCTASEVQTLWLVSCRTFAPGCDSAACESWLSACVTEPYGAILSNKLC